MFQARVPVWHSKRMSYSAPFSSTASLLSDTHFPAGCGLLYLLCWPLYAPGWPWSAALCASVPALATLHFVLVGLGLQSDQDLVRSFSVRPDAKDMQQANACLLWGVPGLQQ